MADAHSTKEAMGVLVEQAKALNLTVDPSWDVDTLALHVLEAQDEKAKADKAAFAAAEKVWVYLNRDAWPVEDEKHLTGETIAVPEAMAMTWYEAGVARPGRKPD